MSLAARLRKDTESLPPFSGARRHCTGLRPASPALFTEERGLITHEGMRFLEQCPQGCCMVYMCQDCGTTWTLAVKP